MNIFEALKEDHDLQRKLVDELIETHGDTDKRDELFKKIKTELHAHAAAEERFFYIPLMKHDATIEQSRHSVAEHHEIDEMIEKLEETDYSSAGWLVEAKHLQHRVHHHLDEEEEEVFLASEKVLTDDQTTELGSEYQREIDEQREKF